jgi:hypothetical protein
MPNRWSLPSMLPPADPAITCVCMPAACWAGEPWASPMGATLTGSGMQIL